MNFLLLRGLAREKQHWGNFPNQLKSLSKIDRVTCLDLPGVGTESGRIFVPYIPQIVQDLRSRFLGAEKNSNNEKWGILGHSLGAMIAMQWVHDYPQDFQNIIVMSSSSREIPIWKRLTPYSMAKLADIFLEKDDLKREKKILEMISNLKKNDPNLQKEWADIAKKTPMARHVVVEQLLAASLFKLPQPIKTNMLVLASRADRMVNYECSKFIAYKYQAPVHIHPTAGHDIALDDPDWILEKLNQWI